MKIILSLKSTIPRLIAVATISSIFFDIQTRRHLSVYFLIVPTRKKQIRVIWLIRSIHCDPEFAVFIIEVRQTI